MLTVITDAATLAAAQKTFQEKLLAQGQMNLFIKELDV